MERNYYPRVQQQFSAVIENEDGVHVNVIAMDASSEGVSIQCNTFVRNLITPGGCFVRDDGKPIELFVWMELPAESGEPKKIGARCHVAFSRRLSSDQCKIGMRYMDFDESSFEILVKYIKATMASNGRTAQLVNQV
jgi:hypothetical protein